MKTSKERGKFRGFILVFSLLFGIGFALSTTAQGQYQNNQDRDRNWDRDWDRDRNWDGYGNFGGSFQLRQTALNAGYNEGIKDGRKDRERGSRTSYRDQRTFQNATKDYSSRLGDRGLYQRYFRDAYRNGYYAESYDQNNRGYDQNNPYRDDRYTNRDDRYTNNDRYDNGNRNRRGRNWDAYGNFGGSFQLRQTALNAGYNEGIKQGRNDRNRSNGSNYRNSSAYQRATQDYNSNLGNRELYQRYYRDAFETGYSDGMNGN